MPFQSEEQRRFFGYCKSHPNDPKCPPPRVIQEFFESESRKESKKKQARRKALTDRRKR
jgi:hypothetical protein